MENVIWSEMDMDKLGRGLAELFPEYDVSLEELVRQIAGGDLKGAAEAVGRDVLYSFVGEFAAIRKIMIWIFVLGVAAAMMSHFIEVFDRHQVADLSFYFMYLCMMTVVFGCYTQAAEAAADAMENIVLFVRLLAPLYLVAVGISSGSVTAGAAGQVLMWGIYGVQRLLAGICLPLVYSFFMLSVLNGIWMEEKLTLMTELLKKAVGWILKGAIGAVTGISFFQNIITPVIDSVKSNTLQKAVSAIPGIGNAADGVTQLLLGSAIVIKNSVGLTILLLLLLLCCAPLLQILMTAVTLKAAAALMGIVSDKRLTGCVDRVGEAGLLLFRTTGTAVLLFLIAVAVVAASTNRGF